MAAAAVAMPSQAFSHKAPSQGVSARPSAGSGYTDPTIAPKTKTCPVPGNLAPQKPGPSLLYRQKDAVYGDWRDDLIRDGYVIVKGVIPKERALAYGDEVFSYLENL